MVGCFVGIVILSMPSISKSQADEEASNEGEMSKELQFYIGIGCAFSGAWLYSTFGVLTKTMSDVHFGVV